MDGDRGVEAQWKRSAVLLVLELLLWLTSADMDRHEGSGGVHGATQPTRSTTEGTSLCRQGGKSVSQAGTSSFSLVPPQALPHRGRHALIYKNQIKQASTESGTTHSGGWIITKGWWEKKRPREEKIRKMTRIPLNSLREYLLVLKIHKKWINPKIHVTKPKIKPLPSETKDRGAET